MRIERFFNTSTPEIDGRKWNPYLGISIQNKAFTPEYIAEFLRWAAPRSAQRTAIVVVDVLQRINNQIFDRSSPMAALAKAFRKADEIHDRIRTALDSLPEEIQNGVEILDWCDIIEETWFIPNYRIFKQEFEENAPFRNFLTGLTRGNLGSIIGRLQEPDIEQLTRYILMELPELVTGFMHSG
ncbi:MAG: tRNA-dependent cyclodipeptide synthase, partial [Synergistaceae bacterium]|nr:tRNA-dependent cyclodipeptide synthase [Synergistaceae bacterium]